MEYRKLSVDEAEQFWSLMNQLDYETKYMLYEPGERTKNLPRIESLIRDSVEGQDFLLVAETDNKLIGYISAQKGRLNRIAHSAYIVVGILTNYRDKGIGTEFFKRFCVCGWWRYVHVSVGLPKARRGRCIPRSYSYKQL